MEFLTFHDGEREFAIDLARVREIVTPPPITRVPGMPPALLGLVGLRGDPTAVVDAGLRLAGRPVLRSPRTPLLVLTVRLLDRPLEVALLVEAAGRKLELDQLLPWSEGQARFAGSDACSGFADVDGSIVLVLDVDQLLSFERIAAAAVLSLPAPAQAGRAPAIAPSTTAEPSPAATRRAEEASAPVPPDAPRRPSSPPAETRATPTSAQQGALRAAPQPTAARRVESIPVSSRQVDGAHAPQGRAEGNARADTRPLSSSTSPAVPAAPLQVAAATEPRRDPPTVGAGSHSSQPLADIQAEPRGSTHLGGGSRSSGDDAPHAAPRPLAPPQVAASHPSQAQADPRPVAAAPVAGGHSSQPHAAPGAGQVAPWARPAGSDPGPARAPVGPDRHEAGAPRAPREEPTGGWAPFEAAPLAGNASRATVVASDLGAGERRAPPVEAARRVYESPVAPREDEPPSVSPGRPSRPLAWLVAAAAIALLLIGWLLFSAFGSEGRRAPLARAEKPSGRSWSAPAEERRLPPPSEPFAPPPREPPPSREPVSTAFAPPEPSPPPATAPRPVAPPPPVVSPPPAAAAPPAAAPPPVASKPSPPPPAQPPPARRVARALPPAMIVTPETPPCEIHEVRRGESLWLISARRLGDPYKWPKVYGENRDHIFDPDVIEIHDRIRIPGGCAPPRAE